MYILKLINIFISALLCSPFSITFSVSFFYSCSSVFTPSSSSPSFHNRLSSITCSSSSTHPLTELSFCPSIYFCNFLLIYLLLPLPALQLNFLFVSQLIFMLCFLLLYFHIFSFYSYVSYILLFVFLFLPLLLLLYLPFFLLLAYLSQLHRSISASISHYRVSSNRSLYLVASLA